MPTPIISADSHVTEHPDTYRDYVSRPVPTQDVALGRS